MIVNGILNRVKLVPLSFAILVHFLLDAGQLVSKLSDTYRSLKFQNVFLPFLSEVTTKLGHVSLHLGYDGQLFLGSRKDGLRSFFYKLFDKSFKVKVNNCRFQKFHAFVIAIGYCITFFFLFIEGSLLCKLQ